MMTLIQRHKNNKVAFYSRNILRSLTPKLIYHRRLQYLLNTLDSYDRQYIASRVNYYLKHNDAFSLPDDKAVSIKRYRKKGQSAYYYDLKEYLHYFDRHFKVTYRFGDDTHLEPYPFLVKARPIAGDNANAVLFKLNKVRHFNFIEDSLSFREKTDKAVWRGAAYQPHRASFVRQYYNHPLCDIGQTNPGDTPQPWDKGFMSIAEQLGYKFILCIEGNDVATNLKWAMSSNSLCMMPKPKYETWFMEGTLKAGVHYVELKDDFSDLEEKIHYYNQHPEAAEAIIANAHEHVHQFCHPRQEKLIGLLVLKKYFELSGQWQREANK
ncbi:glycosyltransferase family 90 protein [Photobacterium sp. WH77]|uniref:glycosyltransferase family 90 protein n=1 Tax=unclassified Photobacterium TaxID=2628852 RepID=UPI001EDACEFA|nr:MULTISPECIES: glycosyltransferase family 90 protein [unclassified Photobacterium]MCG2837122.1 glycosyltransferase family 90 protein [Photobacterium sp. WH77]MCG2844728.1 glycosyltransferase family 90 protein [Photobacterium sp. WH80]